MDDLVVMHCWLIIFCLCIPTAYLASFFVWLTDFFNFSRRFTFHSELVFKADLISLARNLFTLEV